MSKDQRKTDLVQKGLEGGGGGHLKIIIAKGGTIFIWGGYTPHFSEKPRPPGHNKRSVPKITSVTQTDWVGGLWWNQRQNNIYPQHNLPARKKKLWGKSRPVLQTMLIRVSKSLSVKT